VTDDDLNMPRRDSYAEFLGGVWKILTLGKRYVRWVMSDPVEKQAHWKGKAKIEAGWVERSTNGLICPCSAASRSIRITARSI